MTKKNTGTATPLPPLPPIRTEKDLIACMTAALQEIVSRLGEGDIESSVSIARATLLVSQFGQDSPEFQAFYALERARLGAEEGRGGT